MDRTAEQSTDQPRRNRILAALPAADCKRLLPDLEYVELPLGWTMSESGDHVNFLHFPTSGFISPIDELEDGSSSEVALVGSKELVGVLVGAGAQNVRLEMPRLAHGG